MQHGKNTLNRKYFKLVVVDVRFAKFMFDKLLSRQLVIDFNIGEFDSKLFNYFTLFFDISYLNNISFLNLSIRNNS